MQHRWLVRTGVSVLDSLFRWQGGLVSAQAGNLSSHLVVNVGPDA